MPSRPAGEEGGSLSAPPIDSYEHFAVQADGKQMSTTMAAIRLAGALLRDNTFGPPPIVADEARTFGLATCFGRLVLVLQ